MLLLIDLMVSWWSLSWETLAFIWNYLLQLSIYNGLCHTWWENQSLTLVFDHHFSQKFVEGGHVDLYCVIFSFAASIKLQGNVCSPGSIQIDKGHDDISYLGWLERLPRTMLLQRVYLECNFKLSYKGLPKVTDQLSWCPFLFQV